MNMFFPPRPQPKLLMPPPAYTKEKLEKKIAANFDLMNIHLRNGNDDEAFKREAKLNFHLDEYWKIDEVKEVGRKALEIAMRERMPGELPIPEGITHLDFPAGNTASGNPARGIPLAGLPAGPDPYTDQSEPSC